MDYLFENLGDERFQEFCSALISKEFPNFQAFPVGQPDGGRDTIAYNLNTTKKKFIVFQVKFVRNANSVDDSHKWLIETLEKESSKIHKLIHRGAEQFCLITNVKGTAHLDTGSKDKVNTIFESNIDIPSFCWWRDDIARLIEKDPLFKWSFPEILNGQEILNSILFQNIHESREKRENVLRAYLADQYRSDNEVKFKQIDLQNKLFDLFTDVPFRIKKFNEKNKLLKRTLEEYEDANMKVITNEDMMTFERDESIGAAAFLLHPKIQNEIQRVLLEGGPGQGKSTISQYICQVHRAKLLNKHSDLSLLPQHVKNIPVRLPFKIDLRHIAAWIENKNPYLSRLNEDYFNKIWKNSLESFLIGHIVYHSQIDDFNSSDLVAIAKLSSILFVFDGFDEIANLAVREEVIEFIDRGINRLSENANSIQILITSRPAAFNDTIGFDVETYPHFELTDINLAITNDYVEKWIKASRLNSQEGNEIKRLVREKLQMPHLKDLAKSPMQLAIFISLLRTRGESLPNKRTALYDSYIELFFNRESEKNAMIRDQRDLIIDIHQYLAWLLHSEAELLKNGGSIHIDDLKNRLKLYLAKEGHKTNIADELFHVMQERVCALVSRVQNTYEFEIQPLREYFCAKFLYNTSPYSPIGAEKTGTKPERFDAIARNFYWNNVVRFFAGCFDKGELPMLIQKLKELQNDELLKFTNYPRLVTSQILSDWVFTQYPILLKDVVKIIVDGINIGNIINQERGRGDDEPILLPLECGRNEIVQECFDQLKQFPNNDYAMELIGILRNNPYKTLEHWTEFASLLSGEKLITWLRYASSLEIIHKMSDTQVTAIIKKDNFSLQLRKLQLVIYRGKQDILNNDIEIKELAFKGILEGKLTTAARIQHPSSLQFLSMCLQPYSFINLFKTNANIPFINIVYERSARHSHFRTVEEFIVEFSIVDKIDETIYSIKDNILSLLNLETSSWRNSIDPWDQLIELLRGKFQEKWAISILSIISAGIKSKSETYEDYNILTDNNISLCKRVRHARMRSGNTKYWEEQLDGNSNMLFVLVTFFTWATTKTIFQLSTKISVIVRNLTEAEFYKLTSSIIQTTQQSHFNNLQKKQIQEYLTNNDMSDEVKFILSHRFELNYRRQFIYNNIKSNIIKSKEIYELRLDYLIGKYFEDTDNETVLAEIKLLYCSVSTYFKRNFYNERRSQQGKIIQILIANKIMEDSKKYPRVISSLAERSCRVHANKNIKEVGKIAHLEKWLD